MRAGPAKRPRAGLGALFAACAGPAALWTACAGPRTVCLL